VDDKDDKFIKKETIAIVKSKDPAHQANPWSPRNLIIVSDDFFKTEKVILTGGT